MKFQEMKRDIILTYIKHHTSGYDLEKRSNSLCGNTQAKNKARE